MTILSDAPWWSKENPGPVHRRLIPLVRSMMNIQAQRYANMRRMTSVYQYGFGASGAGYANDLDAINDAALHHNVAKNAIDTMVAQTCAPRVAPMLLTEGGTFAQRERAKTATKAVEGILDDNDCDELQEDIVLDAILGYCGFAHVYSTITDGVGDIKIERVMPTDVLVDEAEGRNRKPRCFYRRHVLDRYVVLAMYGGPDEDLVGSARSRKETILKAASAVLVEGDPRLQNTDCIEVWEAWHLPSGAIRFDDDGKAKAHDGRHAIVIEGADFVDEPWDRDRFPIAVYRPEKAREGYWGLAVMRQAMAGQREYESVTKKLQTAHKRMGSSGFIITRNANVNTRELGNGQGQIVECDGPPDSIQPFAPTPANPQTYQYREGIASDIMRYMGVSEMASQSEVPSGMSQASGKALQVFEDTESKRGILRHRARERFVVDLSDLTIDEARSLVRRGVKVESRSRGKGGFDRIDWKDLVEVLEDRKNYVVRTFPVGMLAQTPSAKFAQLDALLDRQVITVEQFKRLYEIPDLEAENAVDSADIDIIDKNLDYMVTTGKYVSPQSFDNLEAIIERAGKVYNAYRIAGVPDARLELVRRYTVDAKAIIDEAKSKAAAMASGPPGMPMQEGMGPALPAPPMGDPMGGAPMPPPPGMMPPVAA